MNSTQQPSMHQTEVIALPSDAHTAATYTTTIDMRGYRWAKIVIQAGTLGSSATVDVTAQEGDESDGSDAADLPDSAGEFTQITEANDNALHVMELYCNSFKRYLTVEVVVAVATSDLSAMVIRTGAVAEPPAAESTTVVNDPVIL